MLSSYENTQLQYYSKANILNLSEYEIIEFQELYCKQQLFVGITSGKFSVDLEFSTDIHSDVKNWLKSYGYYLCPDKPINYNAGWFQEFINPTPESTTKFNLRW